MRRTFTSTKDVIFMSTQHKNQFVSEENIFPGNGDAAAKDVLLANLITGQYDKDTVSVCNLIDYELLASPEPWYYLPLIGLADYYAAAYHDPAAMTVLRDKVQAAFADPVNVVLHDDDGQEIVREQPAQLSRFTTGCDVSKDAFYRLLRRLTYRGKGHTERPIIPSHLIGDDDTYRSIVTIREFAIICSTLCSNKIIVYFFDKAPHYAKQSLVHLLSSEFDSKEILYDLYDQS